MDQSICHVSCAVVDAESGFMIYLSDKHRSNFRGHQKRSFVRRVALIAMPSTMQLGKTDGGAYIGRKPGARWFSVKRFQRFRESKHRFRQGPVSSMQGPQSEGPR